MSKDGWEVMYVSGSWVWSWGSFLFNDRPPIRNNLRHPIESIRSVGTPTRIGMYELGGLTHLTRLYFHWPNSSTSQKDVSLSAILLQVPIPTMMLAHCKATYCYFDHQVARPCYVSYTLSPVKFISFFPSDFFYFSSPRVLFDRDITHTS